MEVSGQLHVPAALTPGKEPVVLLDMWLGGPQGQSERGGKVKVSLCFSLTKQHAMKAYWGNGGIAPRIIWPRH
jgi:hypothetical protein